MRCAWALALALLGALVAPGSSQTPVTSVVTSVLSVLSYNGCPASSPAFATCYLSGFLLMADSYGAPEPFGLGRRRNEEASSHCGVSQPPNDTPIRAGNGALLSRAAATSSGYSTYVGIALLASTGATVSVGSFIGDSNNHTCVPWQPFSSAIAKLLPPARYLVPAVSR